MLSGWINELSFLCAFDVCHRCVGENIAATARTEEKHKWQNNIVYKVAEWCGSRDAGARAARINGTFTSCEAVVSCDLTWTW